MSNLKNAIEYIALSDSTQREGRQAGIFHLNGEDSLKHLKMINDIGIEYAELNHPASSIILKELAQKAVKLNLDKTVVTVHVRCKKRDIETVLETGIKNINIYIPISAESEKTILKSINDCWGDYKEIVKIAKRNKLKIRISLEHSFSISLDIFEIVIKKIAQPKVVTRIGLADTTGTCFPGEMKKYLKKIYQVVSKDKEVQVHLHNDHGLAGANFWQVVNLAQEYKRKVIVDVSFLGLGERNGILSFGDAFSILYIINSNKLRRKYKLNRYGKVKNFIQKRIGDSFERDPLNGNAFSHSAGPHLDGMLKGKQYQKINPLDFGFTSKYNVGHCVTGWIGVQKWVKEKMNKKIGPRKAKEIAAEIRNYTSEKGPLKEKKLTEFIGRKLKMSI
jgi:homocitrate synthase